MLVWAAVFSILVVWCLKDLGQYLIYGKSFLMIEGWQKTKENMDDLCQGWYEETGSEW